MAIRYMERQEYGDMKKIQRYLFYYGIIAFCAFFSCAGFQMIGKDVGMVQMDNFNPQEEKFLELQVSERLTEELIFMEKISGIEQEKLLAAVMLKHQFKPQAPLQKTEVIADVMGYERANQEKFQKITSYYKRMCECVEYLPLADVYSGQDGTLEFCVNDCMEQAEIKIAESGESEGGVDAFWLKIPLENGWQGIVPVICLKSGEVVCKEEGQIELEQEDGIRIIYRNLTDYLKNWEIGEVIQAGEILGSTSGLELQFQLLLENGSWVAFNGTFSLQNGEKMVRSVTENSP